MNKMKKQICYLIVFIMFAMPMAGCNKISKDNKASAGELVSLENVPDFTRDTVNWVNVSGYGDILKLDDITPGLDTYSMKTTLYSLSERKILGQTSLPEGNWATGCVDGGFYAALLDRCEFILYDNECKEIMRKKPVDSGNYWAFAAVSPDKKYLLYGDSYTTDVFVYSISDDTQKRVGIFSDYVEAVGFANGCFFLRNNDGALTKIDPAKERSEVVFVDRRLNFLTPYYSLGKTDVNFMVKTPDQDPLRYTEMSSVDEVQIAAGEPGFVTVASESENDILRVYRVKDNEKLTIKVPESVQQAYFAGERLVIAAKDRESGKIKLYLNDAHSSKASPIKFYDTDKITPSDDLPESPAPPQDAPSIPETVTPDSSKASNNESAVPSTKKMRIEGVPIIAQMPNYPTGCESVTAVMALQFAGEKITVDTFIDQYLEKSSEFYNVGGVHYGPNPYEVFIGNPRSSSAFGCMAPVIEKALVKYYSSDQFIENTTGRGMDELCRDYIDQGIPVMVWTSIKMIEPYYTSQWNLSNGEKYRWLANEHCMLLTGYDDDNYYYNDPYTGKEVSYSKSLSEKRYETFGKQSIVIKK